MTRPHPKQNQRTIKTVLFAESERAARNLSAISSLTQEPTKVLHILMDICCCCPFSSNDVLVCEICAILFRRFVCMGESQCGCVWMRKYYYMVKSIFHRVARELKERLFVGCIRGKLENFHTKVAEFEENWGKCYSKWKFSRHWICIRLAFLPYRFSSGMLQPSQKWANVFVFEAKYVGSESE